jgi:PEP-CTERM motif
MFKFISARLLIVAISSALVTVGEAKAGVITTLYDTGVDSSGAALTGSAVDPHYTLIGAADRSFPGPNAYTINGSNLPGSWMANTATSTWISGSPTAGSEPGGAYIYETTFNLTGFNPATAVLTGQWAMATNGVILLNGVSTGVSDYSTGSSGSWQTFTISSGFLSGINTLDFVIGNGTTGPTGMQVQITGTAAVPEPSSFILVGVVVAVGFVAYRRRRASVPALSN